MIMAGEEYLHDVPFRSVYFTGIVRDEIGRKMFFFIKENTPFDQLIYEYRESDGSQWLHVSYNIDGGRRQAFMNYIMKRK